MYQKFPNKKHAATTNYKLFLSRWNNNSYIKF